MKLLTDHTERGIINLSPRWAVWKQVKICYLLYSWITTVSRENSERILCAIKAPEQIRRMGCYKNL